MDVLQSVKEINMLRKGINRLLSKGMFIIHFQKTNKLRKEINRLLSKGMLIIQLKK